MSTMKNLEIRKQNKYFNKQTKKLGNSNAPVMDHTGGATNEQTLGSPGLTRIQG